MTSLLPGASGIHDLELDLQAAGRARCTVALPPGMSADRPLVLCLHYGGEPQGYYGRALLEHLLVPAFNTLGAVMIAPVVRAGDWTSPDNMALALAALRLVESTYGTAASRRVVTGYSMGAIGTWHLLKHEPTMFSAAVPIAGPPPASRDQGTTPVYALHSTQDQLFPSAATVAFIEALAGSGRVARCGLLSGVDHFSFGEFETALAAVVPWLCECWEAA